jgi:hypothetical protein
MPDLSATTSPSRARFELVSFELVRAGERSALLRLSARGIPGSGASIALLADDGRRTRELPRLREPAPARQRSPLWTAAFAVGADLIDARPAFAARMADGTLVDLRAPQERRRPKLATASVPANDLEAPLSEARRRALLVVQRDLQSERAVHAETKAEAKRLRLDLTRAGSMISRLRESLEEARIEAEDANAALEATRHEVARLRTALSAAEAEAHEREERAAADLEEITVRLEAETARHILDGQRSAAERAALETQISAAMSELEQERVTIEAMRAETAMVAQARDEAERRLTAHGKAITLFEAALDLQMERAVAAEEEVDALEHEREAETQDILKLVRTARANDVGDSKRSPFPKWERTRRRLAHWANGEPEDEDVASNTAEDRGLPV